MKKNKKALILAGGLGTRLRPLTFAIPKPLIPVKGRPIIDYIVSRLMRHGFDDIYVSLNYKADLIRLYFSDKPELKGHLTFLEEKAPLGTAGPLKLLGKTAGDDPVLVINGDILTDLDFSAFLAEHRRAAADLTVGMINYGHRLSYGVLELDGENRVRSVEEKPELNFKASAGIYLVGGRSLGLVPRGFYTMPELINDSLRRGLNVHGSLIKKHWLAIEHLKNIEEVSARGKGGWILKI